MASYRTAFQVYLEEEIDRYKGVFVPVKSGFLERVFVKKASVKALHPNPEDEFCDPHIGPNYEIITGYEHEILTAKKLCRSQLLREPLIVEKIRPDGYMLLNGHHRWAAAVRMTIAEVPIRIVNLTHASDIQRMVENAKHDKRVTLDLDEVVFVSEQDEAAEKALPFFAGRVYKERLRCGVPALFRYLKLNGYDIWVYTAGYYSMEYIRHLFKWYGVRIDNIVTGTSRKGRLDAADRKRLEALVANRYAYTIHLDADSLVRIDSGTRSYEEFPLTGDPRTWSQQIMEIIGRFETHEG
ncbi:MAG: ParB N-terminal domain-containing protein [Clostridia bacterium]|nr:ParB N-terminal domain-containing protein [Clostridia bacterium]